MSSVCPVDGADMASGLCARCRQHLVAWLKAVPEAVSELEITLSRQDRMGTGARVKRSSMSPLLFNTSASDALWSLDNVLSAWVREVSSGLVRQPDAAHGARWLLSHLNQVLRHPDIAELVDELSDAVQRAYCVVDRPEEQWPCGVCERCDTELRAPANARLVECLGCGHRYGVVELRERRLRQAEDQLATAPTIARVLGALIGQTRSDKSIHTWHRHGRLFRHGLDLNGQPLYRIGDVIALALAQPKRRHS